MSFRGMPRVQNHRVTAGFTLVELLIVIVVVGLLVALGMPRLSATRGRSLLAAMRSDLRNFAAYEESYFYDTSVYTPDLAELSARGFQTSEGVSLTIVEATVTGWSVIAEHPSVSEECGLFVGNAAPVGPALSEGEIACQ